MLLFAKEVTLSDQNFLIEISRTNTKVYFIAFEKGKQDQGGRYSLEVTQKQMFKILSESGNSFDAVIDRLYIHRGSDRLCLVDFLKMRHSPSSKHPNVMNVSQHSNNSNVPLYYHNGAFSSVADPSNKTIASPHQDEDME